MSSSLIIYGETLETIEENANKLGYQQGIIKAYENNSRGIYEPYYRAWPREIDDIIKEYKDTYNDYEDSYEEFIEEAYREGFEKGYNKIIEDRDYESGGKKEKKINYAETLGKVLGELYGCRDFYNDDSSNWHESIPTNRMITDTYNLSKETLKYRKDFLKTFRIEFEKGYNEGYRKANFEPIKISYEKGYDYGKEIGKKTGEANAIKDCYLGLNNNWERHDLAEYQIRKEYNLNLALKEFEEGFISGFKEGMSLGYIIKYQEISKGIMENKTKVETIPISGGEISNRDGIVNLKINPGTYYNPIVVWIDILQDNLIRLDKDFIKASDYYNINIANKSSSANNEENIELKIEYYGNQDGGIYKLVNGKWLYLPSQVEGGFIRTELKPNSFKNSRDNIYCVLIDTNAQTLPDIRGHWAKDEITAFLRRGMISGYSDKTFKPDTNLSRGEFLSMLSKVYDWNMPRNVENIMAFKDYGIFSPYEKAISYAINKGYINGYPDKTFKPHKNISYKEVESIMRKIIKSDDFHWYNISAKMLYQKNYRSKSYNNMDNYITRAETVYMPYLLNEWKY